MDSRLKHFAEVISAQESLTLRTKGDFDNFLLNYEYERVDEERAFKLQGGMDPEMLKKIESMIQDSKERMYRQDEKFIEFSEKISDFETKVVMLMEAADEQLAQEAEIRSEAAQKASEFQTIHEDPVAEHVASPKADQDEGV